LEYIFASDNISEALTAESLGTLNPDYIFLDSGVDKTYITSLSSAENLSAVTNEKIFSLSSDSFSSLKEEPLNSLSELLKTE
jgi:ABC-type Fe3+-hydroxamate transport system substrate-binding protein